VTKHEVASLACRVLALYAIISAFGILWGTVQQVISSFVLSSMLSNPSKLPWSLSVSWPLLVYGIPFSMQALFGIGLWIFADGLGNVMVKEGYEMAGTGHLRSSDIQMMAFAVIGMLSLAQGLPRLGSSIMQYYFNQRLGAMRIPMQITMPGEILASTMQIVIGLALLLGARGLTRLIYYVHEATQDKVIEAIPVEGQPPLEV